MISTRASPPDRPRELHHATHIHHHTKTVDLVVAVGEEAADVPEGISRGGVGAHTGGHEVKDVIKERVGVDEHGGRRRGWLGKFVVWANFK